MARPKLGDSATERLHIKITADEIKAIDDWRFSNRVPSRSEAVRRLVQIGLLLDDQAIGIANAAVLLHEKYTDEVIKLASVLNEEGVDLNVREASYIRANFDHQLDTTDRMEEFLYTLRMLMAPLEAMKEGTDFRDAQLASLSAKARSMSEALQNKLQKFESRRDDEQLAEDDK